MTTVYLDAARVRVGDLKMPWAVLDALRPGHGLALPGPALTATWDGTERRYDRGDKVLVRDDDWPEAEVLRTDDALANDLARFQSEREVVTDSQDPDLIGALAFLQRLTKQERRDIRAAAETDDDIGDWIALLQAARQIRLSDVQTQAGLQAVADAGILTNARRDELLKP